MTLVEFIKKAIKGRSHNMTTLAKAMGYKGCTNMQSLLCSGKSMSVKNLYRIMNELDYDIIIKSRLTDKDEYKLGEES